MRLAPSLLLILFAGLAACAPAGPTDGARTASATSGRQCFRPAEVNGFDALDREHVDVTTGVRQVWRLEIIGTCPDIDWSQRIGIRSTGGGNWVCQGMDAELIVPSPSGAQRCPVTSVRKLSAEEVQALRPKRRH